MLEFECVKKLRWTTVVGKCGWKGEECWDNYDLNKSFEIVKSWRQRVSKCDDSDSDSGGGVGTRRTYRSDGLESIGCPIFCTSCTILLVQEAREHVKRRMAGIGRHAARCSV